MVWMLTSDRLTAVRSKLACPAAKSPSSGTERRIGDAPKNFQPKSWRSQELVWVLSSDWLTAVRTKVKMYPQRNHQALGRGVAFDTQTMLSVERLTQPRVGPGAFVRSRDVGQVESRMSRQRNRQALGRNLIAYTDIQQIQLQIYCSGVSQKSSLKKVLGSVFFQGCTPAFRSSVYRSQVRLQAEGLKVGQA